MGDRTAIQWTDSTINPFRARLSAHPNKVGHYCEKISPGCKNCYASEMQLFRFGLLEFTLPNRPLVDLFLDHTKLEQVLRLQRPRKIFWCDMTDIFYEGYPNEWIDRCIATMMAAEHHTHQILTKRTKRMREYFNAPDLFDRLRAAANRCPDGSASDLGHPNIVTLAAPNVRKAFKMGAINSFGRMRLPAPNIWIGASMENQEAVDQRMPDLLGTKASVRFVSAEPLLGPIDLGPIHLPGVPHLDWVIVGGESGPKARPCNLEWIESLVEQCRAARVAPFVKQVGAKPVDGTGDKAYKPPKDHKGGEISEWSPSIQVREFPHAEGTRANL